MSVWTILANLQIIMSVISEIEMVISQVMTQNPPVPSIDQVKKVMDVIRKLLDAGIIKIAGVDDKDLSAKLLSLENMLSSGAYELLKTVVRNVAPDVVLPVSHPDIPVAPIVLPSVLPIDPVKV